MKKRKIKVKVGDVFQIPLPDGRFAYGRVYRDAAIGIYHEVSTAPNTPPIGSRNFIFNVGIYEDVLTSGQWPIVGHDKFDEGESEWPPPNCIKDPLSGKYRIYFKGEMRPATEEECKKLEEAAVWDAHHITARILREMEKK